MKLCMNMSDLPVVFDRWRIPEEVQENSLKVRTREPRRNRIPALKNPALGNDVVVDFGAGIVSENDGGT